MSTRFGRRRFLLLAGGVIGAGALVYGGATTLGLNEPYTRHFVESTCGKGNKMGRILVAYASKCGSTGEVAAAVGQVLCAAGAEVDVLRAQQVKDLSPYSAVVLGSAARMGRLLPEARAFAARYSAALSRLPTAYFFVGITMNHDTPENREKAAVCMEPLRQVKEPVSMGFFGGKVDPATLEPVWRFATRWIKEGDMAPGDHRDFQAIRAWAGELMPLLAKA